MKYEDLLKILGEFGKYQKIQYALVCVVTFTLSFHSMNMVFIGAVPDHTCKMPIMHEAWHNLSYSSGVSLSRCYITYNRTESDWPTGNAPELNISKQYCPNGWDYSTQYFQRTIVTEWDLVCEDAWKRSAASSVFFAGRLTGALVAGQLSDIIGRRPVFLASTLLISVVGCGASFSPSVYLFYCLYFLQGLLQVSAALTSFVLGVELLGTKSRTVFVFTQKLADCLGQASLAGVAFFIRDWRWLEFTISVVFLIYLTYYWLVPESVRWLMSKGKQNQAKAVILRAAKINKVYISSETLDNIDVEGHSTSTYTAIDLIKRWKFAKISLNIWYQWLANAMVYYGLTINSGDMGLDPYISYSMSCLIEVPALLLALVLVDRLGRRKLLFAFMSTGAIACLATAFVPSYLVKVSAALSILGKFGVSGSYAMMYLISAEIFPTVVRNVGMGTASMSARLGGLLAPGLLFLSTYFQPLPMLVFAGITFLAALLGLLLPDVTGRPLAQNFSDVDISSNEKEEKLDEDTET